MTYLLLNDELLDYFLVHVGVAKRIVTRRTKNVGHVTLSISCYYRRQRNARDK